MSIRTKNEQKRISADEAKQMLVAGNQRFVSSSHIKRSWLDEVHHSSSEQNPFAAILSCIDSRIPAEIIFDQGVGDVFSVRIAGNIVNNDILGSLEFATKVVGTKLILVLGHTSCGAIQGACNGVELGYLTGLLNKIQPVINQFKTKTNDANLSGNQIADQIAQENVRHTMQAIVKESSIIKQLIDENKISLQGAMYDVKTGQVEFLKD